MNHKRRRPPLKRGARCLCHGVLKKLYPHKLGCVPHSARRGDGAMLRLRERAREAA